MKNSSSPSRPRSSALICGVKSLHRGFTLFEVMLAIALIIALGGAMFGFLFNTLEMRNRINDRTAQHRAAAALIERLEADLAMCIVGNATFGAGVAGDESSLRILTRGVAASLAGDGDDSAFCDLQRSEYRFNAGLAGIELRRHVAGNDRGEFHPFGGAIHTVRFRYHDGARWLPSFDSLDADRLPVAVEVAVWFEHQFTAAVAEDDQGDPVGFDEYAWATRAERDQQRIPQPDRVRVIAIIDADGEERDE